MARCRAEVAYREWFQGLECPDIRGEVTEIVGLYLDPPHRAVVLCVGEKSRIQALDWTQPGLPLKKGRAATMTHDDKRHGTCSVPASGGSDLGGIVLARMSRFCRCSRKARAPGAN